MKRRCLIGMLDLPVAVADAKQRAAAARAKVQEARRRWDEAAAKLPEVQRRQKLIDRLADLRRQTLAVEAEFGPRNKTTGQRPVDKAAEDAAQAIPEFADFQAAAWANMEAGAERSRLRMSLWKPDLPPPFGDDTLFADAEDAGSAAG